MSVTVTLDMYSGLPNPSWELSDRDAKRLSSLLAKKRALSFSASPSALGRLGYRGLIVSSTGGGPVPESLRVFDGILEAASLELPNVIDQNSDVEEYLLGTAGNALRQEEYEYVRKEIQKNVSGGIANSVKDFELMSVPPYDPGKWNNDRAVLISNNCYNYGNDRITNTFAQPGRGSGMEGPYPPTCAGTSAAAMRDGLKSIPSADLSPTEGHVVALVVASNPGFLDYHWYRRDNNTMWSHKPGGTAARNIDNSGRAISDPRACDRGPYNDFCGFFHCIPSMASIR